MLGAEWIKGLYVDGSGVIWDDGFPKTVSKYAEIYGIDPVSLHKTKDKHWPDFSLGKIGSQEFWRNTFREHGIHLSEEEIQLLNMEVLESHYLYHDVMATLKDLSSNYRLGLLTNSPREWIEYWYKKYNLGFFHVIVIPSECNARKPEIEMFEYSARKMGLRPEQIAVFDDQKRNADGARQAGMVGVEVVPGTNPFLELIKNEK